MAFATTQTGMPVEVKNTFIEYGAASSIKANVMNDFAKRKSAPSMMVSGNLFDEPVMVAAPSVQVTAPVVTQVAGAPVIGLPGQRRRLSSVISAASPMVTTAAPTLSLPMSMPQGARYRTNTAMTTSSSVTTSPAGRRLSFDVPATPESAWVGGSVGSMYSFGMPAALPMSPPQQTISEMAPVKTVTMTTVGPTAVGSAGMAPVLQYGGYNPAQMQGFMPGYGQMYPGMPMPYMQEGGQVAYMPMQFPMGMMGGMPGYGGMPTAYAQAGVNDGMRLELGSLIPTNVAQASAPGSSGPVTTVMLRNIPLKYNREALLADLDARGFTNTYDFFYLPIDFHTGNNVGYAFINFDSAATVARLKATYNGLQLSADSAKICEVSDAKGQGKLKNIDQYRNSSVMNMEDRYQPIVLENGVRQPFPPPTRSLKPVKPRARAQ